MRRLWMVALTSAGLALPVFLNAQQAKPPANATARCTDGTFSTAKAAQGMCSAHKGVARWIASARCGDRSISRSTTRKGTCSGHGGVAEWLATARCTDGTLSRAMARQGACSGHGGVAEWLEEPKS